MNEIINAATTVNANVHFTVKGITYVHDGSQIFMWNGQSWVLYQAPVVQAWPAKESVHYAQQSLPTEADTVRPKGNMNTFFKGEIMGNLAADPDFRTATTTGKLCCNFNVAVNNYGDEKPTWFHVCCFGKVAEAQQGVLKKGAKVLVHVHLVKSTEWTDQQGIKRYGTDYHTKEIHWLFKKAADNAYQAPAQQPLPLNQPQQSVQQAPAQQFVQQFAPVQQPQQFVQQTAGPQFVQQPQGQQFVQQTAGPQFVQQPQGQQFVAPNAPAAGQYSNM